MEKWADHPEWPRRCAACGTAFTESDARQVFLERVYRRADTGELLERDDAGPGAMYWAWWYPKDFGSEFHKARGGGPHLMVKLPDGHTWDVDSKASNGPGWQRSGEAPLVTANPSIQGPKFHGWLREGLLAEC